MNLGFSLGLRSGTSGLAYIPPQELTFTEGFTTTHDGQIIEGLDIWCDNNPLVVQHAVTIRWIRVRHKNGMGIRFIEGSEGSVIHDVSVEHVDPPSGTLGFPDTGGQTGQVNIEFLNTSNIRGDRIKVSHGASGVYLQNCSGINITTLEGFAFHGPFPRGQLYQQNGCTNCSLRNWSVDNPVNASHPEDAINLYNSTGFYIGQGRINGNNAGNGVGVMVETGSVGTVEDVDATGMWNGAFSSFYAGASATFINVRTRDNYPPGNNPGGRDSVSTSNGATFVAGEGGVATLTGSYFNVSNPSNIRVEFNGGEFTSYSAIEDDFTPRAFVSVQFPEAWPPFVPPPDPSPNLWETSSTPSSAAWSKVNVTASAGTGEGGSDAVRETATTGEHLWSREWTKESGAIVYEVGVILKPQGRTRLNLFVYDSTYGSGSIGYFFMESATAVPSSFGSMSNPSLSITGIDNGFFECVMTVTSHTSTTMPVVFYVSAADYEQSHAGNTSLGFDVRELSLRIPG